MKNKVVKGLLIVGVSVIWIFVLMKATNMMSNQDKEFVSSPIAIASDNIPEFEKDTFNLAVLKRDPFLGTHKNSQVVAKRKKSTKSVNTSKKITPNNTAKVATPWPKLKYFGFMKGGDSKEKLAMIRINSKLHRVRENEKVNEIHIQAVYADSVVLKMNSQNKTIRK